MSLDRWVRKIIMIIISKAYSFIRQCVQRHHPLNFYGDQVMCLFQPRSQQNKSFLSWLRFHNTPFTQDNGAISLHEVSSLHVVYRGPFSSKPSSQWNTHSVPYSTSVSEHETGITPAFSGKANFGHTTAENLPRRKQRQFYFFKEKQSVGKHLHLIFHQISSQKDVIMVNYWLTRSDCVRRIKPRGEWCSEALKMVWERVF